ncbi:MAG TPA: potassium channel family protein [Albidovulum sp.]|uniref:potassium channel family protein n=1 Tax=Albidovulum sp. TaxID=1872424 RepID=UPI002C723F34|nr:potassium channel family protein [Albidovulum sp.]
MRRLFQRSLIVSLGICLLGGGTIFFHYWEGWAWVDAWLFTVVTVSTVGYGNLVPATTVGKLVASGMIIAGIGVFALLGNEVAERLVHRRETGVGGNGPSSEHSAQGNTEAITESGES